jgi:hypothetical protein
MVNDRIRFAHLIFLISFFCSVSLTLAEDGIVVYQETFDSYENGTDPTGWTDVLNTMEISTIGSEKVYKLTGPQGTSGLSYYNGSEVSGESNYSVDAVLYKNSGTSVGVAAGISNGGENCYKFYWSAGTTKPKLVKSTNGVETTLGWGGIGLDWNWDYRLWRLKVLGNQITGQIYTKKNPAGNWDDTNLNLINTVTATDSGAILSGGIGIYAKFEYSLATHAVANSLKFMQLPQPGIATYEEKTALADICVIQSKAAITLNKAILLDQKLQRSKLYLASWTNSEPLGQSSNASIQTVKNSLSSIENQFIPLAESHFGQLKDRSGNLIPYSSAGSAMLLNPDARLTARANFQQLCNSALYDANSILVTLTNELSATKNAVRNISGNWDSTPLFARKPPATLLANGKSTGIVCGIKIDPWSWGSLSNDLHSRIAELLGSQSELGVYAFYDGAINEGASKGRKTQIIAPSANHDGTMFTDITWYRNWYSQTSESIDRREKMPSNNSTWLWSLDFRHPAVKSKHSEFLLNVANMYKTNQAVLTYSTLWESNFGSKPPANGGHTLINTSDARTISGIDSFRQFLQNKFGSIQNLNSEWNSNYASFESINPPPDPINPSDANRFELLSLLSQGKCTPLYYEFNLWFKNSNSDWLAWCYDTLKNLDPCTPVSLSPTHGNIDGFLGTGRDSFQWAQRACDIYGSEYTGSVEEVFHWSIQKLLNRSTAIFECIWNEPENWNQNYRNNEDIMRASGSRNFWRMIAWGRSLIGFYAMPDSYDGIAYNNIMTFESGYKLLRQSGAVIGPLTDEIRASEDIWLDADVIQPSIAMLKPSTSQMISWPLQSVEDIIKKIHNLLYNKNYHYIFVPEEYIISGSFQLSNYKVLILPYAIHLPEPLSQLILDWVDSGGTLIIAGVAGAYTPYGEKDGKLMNAIFGNAEYTLSSYPTWEIKTCKLTPDMKYYPNNGKVFIAKYGKGKILISPKADNISEGGPAEPLVLSSLDQAVNRGAYSTGTYLEINLRVGSNNIKHLTIINPDPINSKRATIYLDGNYQSAVDRGIEGGLPVNLCQMGSKQYFGIKLAPGEGTVIDLLP